MRTQTDRELLVQRIKESGLSNRKFGTLVVLRDERTIRRWLSGENSIPGVVVRYLLDPLKEGYRR